MAPERDIGGVNNNRLVKIHEACKVPPFSDDSTAAAVAATTLPLTYFDTYCFNLSPVDILLFYEIKDLTWDSFNSEILPKLKHSLSITLLHYLPVAGHLMWPPDAEKPALYYFKDDGVSVTVAESNADLRRLLSSNNGTRRAVEFHPLAPRLSISEDKAEVTAIQITLFPNQGFSICISVHHTVIDGKSAVLFIKSWAYLCKKLQQQNVVVPVPSLLPESLTPCFDRSLIKDPHGIDMVYVKQLMAFTGSDPNTRSLKVTIPVPKVDSNLVRKTFTLTREDLNKLKHKLVLVNKDQHPSKQLHLSTFVLTCAHVFVCLVKARGEDTNTTVTFWVPADCRSRLDPPLPGNYFGSCILGEFAVAKAGDFMQEDGIAFVAEKLSDSVKGLKKGDAIIGTEDRIARELEVMKETGEQSIEIAIAGGTRHFDFYDSDFGWGKPNKVEIVSIDGTGAISLMQSRDGGSVEIGVVLDEPQMEVFTYLFVSGLNDRDDTSHPLRTVLRSRC
ncbi:hypothetical protein WN944_002283 [Citrus x changshan-huyou]|uniref:Uncharacterized protein n=1 Tax=Citrus x changshan-huyou TaxID=2935761 RepID=A0AAP0MIR7_9ROSI